MSKRVVVITGASSGIGRASAELFAQRGWRVGLIARGQAGLEAVRRDLEANGATVAIAPADVSDSAQLESAAAGLEAALGPIDVWINNAGIGVFGRFMDVPEDEFRRVTETNYFGTVNGTRVALRRMLPRNAGTVVQILSLISYRGAPLQSPYSGSKYALRGFTEAVRAEMVEARSRVHLTMVHPPAVNTPFYNHAASHMAKAVRPPPPIYQPEVVAEGVYLAATTRRREVKVAEPTVGLALGNKLMPSLLDFMAGQVGVALQQTDRGGAVAVRDRNLERPGQLAASHGAFDDESLTFSPQMWLQKNRDGLGVGLGLVALALLAGGFGKRGA